MSSVSPTVAVLFHRLGPYHFARLRAAGRLLPVVAIESSGVDETYGWDKVAGADHFERVTLFDCADAQKLPAAEVAGRVGSALDKVRPAVVVVPGWTDSAALGALQWCVQNQVPAVAMSESTAWDDSRSVWREAVKRQVVGLGSAALVGGTPHKEYMVKLGMPTERIFLGYDAVDNGYFEDKAAEVRSQKSEVRREYGLPENYFLASARFIEKKNLPRLIEAYARYRVLAENAENLPGEIERQTLHGPRKAETLPSEVANHRLHGPGKAGNTSPQPSPQSGEGGAPWDLVLLGDGPLRPDLCHLISDLRLQDSVHLPGFKQYPDLPAYYGWANAFIHASSKEPWGLVVNEAMASGLPVLVSNRCGCAQDLVQDGTNGFTFDPNDVEQLAQLMLRISTLESSSPPRSGRGNEGEVSNSDSNPPSALSRQSSILHPPSSTLAEMGAASACIIAGWGPERFAQGLKAAAECALRAGPIKPSLLQRMILKALLWK